jgi:hypothetical protein
MMTDVACFCGCLYSFDGRAGACPRCGECATVRTGSALACADDPQPREQRFVPLWQDRQNAQTTRRFSRYDRVPFSDLPAGVSLADALTGDPRTLRVTQG